MQVITLVPIMSVTDQCSPVTIDFKAMARYREYGNVTKVQI